MRLFAKFSKYRKECRVALKNCIDAYTTCACLDKPRTCVILLGKIWHIFESKFSVRYSTPVKWHMPFVCSVLILLLLLLHCCFTSTVNI